MDKDNITVVGAGVIGLTTAVTLQESKFDVTIRTTAVHPHTTSSVAAALWFPYEVYPVPKVDEWSIRSYREYVELSSDSLTGVSMIANRQISDHKLDRPRWSHEVGEFAEISAELLPVGYSHGYCVQVPLIETPIYMEYLLGRFLQAGGEILVEERPVTSLDADELEGIVVNCTGLGARTLCGDENMYPIKGQIVRTSNPGIEAATCDDESSNAVCYVIPRKSDCILGGIAVKDEWSLAIDSGVTQDIIRRCNILDTRLKSAMQIESLVGLRPGRTEVRLEVELLRGGRRVVHNYGHGGGGFTLAWGCASEVLDLLEEMAPSSSYPDSF